MIGQAGKRNRQADVSVKVRLLSGQEQWILVHLEIQSSYEEAFASGFHCTTPASIGFASGAS